MVWLQELLTERREEVALSSAMAGLSLPDTDAMEWKARLGGPTSPSQEEVGCLFDICR